jgi:hypothetical protein
MSPSLVIYATLAAGGPTPSAHLRTTRYPDRGG